MSFKEELDDDGRERVTEEEERITVKGESTEIKIFRRYRSQQVEQ